MYNKTKFIGTTLSVVFFFTLSLFAKTYHVSLKGNDNNNGSKNSPFRTLKKGVTLLTAGDTLIVEAGNYGYEYNIRISNSGTPEKPIVVMAEKPGSVFLKGPRKKGEEELYLDDWGEGSAIVIDNSSYVVLDGFHVSDYEVGINVGGPGNKDAAQKPHYVTVKRCILEKNGAIGIETYKTDSVYIYDCQFISDKIKKSDGKHEYLVSIQDYGCNFYGSTGTIIENNYFYGAHHQALSFKEGNKDCIVKKNIFEGAQYTAIYFGQNRRADARPDNQNPMCSNLTAEYNIVRPAKGYRVKSPIRVENTENAVIRYNYFEGFDKTGKTAGINVWDEALGNIEIYNNILAFGQDNTHSAGINLELGGSSEVSVDIHNNTFYRLVKDLELDWYRGDNTEGYKYYKNIVCKCKHHSGDDADNFYGEPQFKFGEPQQLPISDSPSKPDFEIYYKKLTDPFRLKEGTPAQGFGVQFK